MDMPIFLTKKADGKIGFIDPRPDLGNRKESALYGFLILKAWQKNPELAYILHGFRCQGAKVVPSETTLKLEPVIGKEGWVNEEDYKANRKYLLPFTKQLIEIMGEIGGMLNGKTSIAS